MSESEHPNSSIRARGEEAVGELAQALLENPLLNTALGRRWAPASAPSRHSEAPWEP